MCLAIRYACLFAILGVVGTEAANQRPSSQSPPVFGRPGQLPEPTFTLFVGAWDKNYLKQRGVESGTGVVIAFPESSMIITADGARWDAADGITLTGNARIKIDTNAKEIFDRITGGPNVDAIKIQLP